MRIIAWTNIVTSLLILGTCGGLTSGSGQTEAQEPVTASADVIEEVEQRETTDQEDGPEAEPELPILPPIILLDFGNGTDDDNSSSGEEKSKRTVNDGLGYGYHRNSFLQNRKYNYYFPAGKTGTTVSIEESISPFLPKTIIEKVRPNGERIQAETYGGTAQAAIFRPTSGPSLGYDGLTRSQSQVFGVRTKLYKTTLDNFPEYQHRSTVKPSLYPQALRYRSTSTTQRPPGTTSDPVGHVTPGPPSYTTARPPDSISYGTQAPSLGQQDQTVLYYSQGHSQGPSQSQPQGLGGHQGQRFDTSSSRPPSYESLDSQGPRYSVENGVRYENKVYWKYPDGTVSDQPPRTYVETTYPGYPGVQDPKTVQGSIYETGSGVYSQAPAQFPAAPDSLGNEPSPFISSMSLSSSLPQQQVYRIGYQNLLTQKQSTSLAQQAKIASNSAPASTSSFSSGSRTSSSSSSQKGLGSKGDRKEAKFDYEAYLRAQYAKYMVNSPNPEYTSVYPTEPTVKTTTPAAKYLPRPEQARKPSPGTNLDSFSNLDYTDLLNYNPSISQYVRNPSSILNVHPTFVQAGNSLIPVIILRVDGAPPETQSKVTPNINLKSLLRQYLLQYASNLQQLTRPSTGYELGGLDTVAGDQESAGSAGLDPLPLTRNQPKPTDPSNSYEGITSYESDHAESKSFKYGERTKARQRVKSVQIIDDPRFTGYKVKN